MNPRTVWRCHPIALMISVIVAPLARCSIAITSAILLPARGPSDSVFAAFLPLGAALTGVAFLDALPFVGAPFADCAPPLAFLSALAFAGAASGLAGSGSGATIWPSFSTRSQILVAAVLPSLRAFSGFTPGRLL